jgi:glucokinase
MSKLYAGVDLGGTSFIAIIADKKGKVLGKSDCVTVPDAPAAETIASIGEHVRLAARDAGVKMKNVEAVGVGAAGAVDPERGVVVRAPNLGWDNVPLSKILGKALDTEVVLGNDVQVAIIGEHAFGAAKGTRRAAGIWVGTGIGGGLIVDGKLDRGARGAAGEIGHMVIQEDGPECHCGRRGCFEAFASRTAMERDVLAAGDASLVPKIMQEKGRTRMTSSIMEHAIEAGDPVMKDVLARAQHYLGLLAANVVNLFDPEMIVIGGGIAERFGSTFVEPIEQVARTRYLRPDPEFQVRIDHARLGEFSGALGACALARASS